MIKEFRRNLGAITVSSTAGLTMVVADPTVDDTISIDGVTTSATIT